MTDDPPNDAPPHDDAEITASGELLPADGSEAPAPAGRDGAALVHWLEQSHRDAAANRAQTRELVRTLEQVRDAHEYVGRALRDERARSRRLMAALVVAPILAGLLVWGVWSQIDDLRSDLSRQVGAVADGQAELQRTQDGLRLTEAAQAQRTRAEALESELDRVRSDVEGMRSENARREEARAGEAVVIRARMEELEEESAEVAGLRAQLKAMRSRTGVDSARTAELEREVRRLERELGAAGSRGGGTDWGRAVGGGRSSAAADPPPRPTPRRTSGSDGTRRAPTGASAASSSNDGNRAPEADPAAATEAGEEPTGPDPAAGAVRRPEDLARIKKELNRLLSLSPDSVGYRVDMVGGVRGETLLDVVISGVDGKGRVIRSLDAPQATVRVRADEGDVVVELRDGHLILAGRRAPFFDGRYNIVLKSNGTAWRTSGLTCLVFE